MCYLCVTKAKNMTPANLVTKIADKKIVKNYGITEAFFFDGEFYMTSIYDLGFELYAQIEKELEPYK